MADKADNKADCLIIGGGPAGLTAAIYLARFRRNVIVVDEGHSRAQYIKHSYNYPGFTGGIEGNAFLENLRKQATQYGARLVSDKILSLEKTGDIFTAATGDGAYTCRKVLLATGVVDVKPDLENMREFIYEGAVRFCPICDGFEASDKRVGIMGPLEHVIGKALFLRTYTKEVFLLPTDHLDLSEDDRKRLEDAEIAVPQSCAINLKSEDSGVKVSYADGTGLELDILYPAMGAEPRSHLAINLGAGHNDQGCLISDAHQQTKVEGLYVAGDLTTDLSQISVATGQAAIAAAHMHNNLPENWP